VAVVAVISSTSGGAGSIAGQVIIFLLFAIWFRSCYLGRKEYFADEKKKKLELIQKSKIEREVMTTSNRPLKNPLPTHVAAGTI